MAYEIHEQTNLFGWYKWTNTTGLEITLLRERRRAEGRWLLTLLHQRRDNSLLLGRYLRCWFLLFLFFLLLWKISFNTSWRLFRFIFIAYPLWRPLWSPLWSVAAGSSCQSISAVQAVSGWPTASPFTDSFKSGAAIPLPSCREHRLLLPYFASDSFLYFNHPSQPFFTLLIFLQSTYLNSLITRSRVISFWASNTFH